MDFYCNVSRPHFATLGHRGFPRKRPNERDQSVAFAHHIRAGRGNVCIHRLVNGSVHVDVFLEQRKWFDRNFSPSIPKKRVVIGTRTKMSKTYTMRTNTHPITVFAWSEYENPDSWMRSWAVYSPSSALTAREEAAQMHNSVSILSSHGGCIIRMQKSLWFLGMKCFHIEFS